MGLLGKLHAILNKGGGNFYVINCNLKSGKNFSVKMLKQEGREQIAGIIHTEGWTAFEYPMPIVFTACIDKFNGTVLDVGANVGYYSILSASNKSNKVIAFEPFSSVTTMLKENIAVNGLMNQVEIKQVAVSDKSGEGILYIPDDSHGLVETSASLDSQFKENILGEVKVNLMQLDELVDEVENVSVIKIDVEGNEKAVLDGAQKIIIKNRPLIFIEILERVDNVGYTNFLQKIDYVDLRLSSKYVIQAESVMFDADAWNHLWVPKENVDTVKELVELEDLSWLEERMGKEEHRSGNGKAELYDIAIFDVDEKQVTALTSGGGCEIRYKVRFKDNIKSPIYAMTIKNIHGQDVYGTNTWFQNHEFKEAKQGEVVEVKFKQQMNLIEGDYSVSVGCVDLVNEKIIALDRRYDSVFLRVVAENRDFGIANLKSDIQVDLNSTLSL